MLLLLLLLLVVVLSAGSIDRTVRLWDVGTGHSLHTLKGHNDEILDVTFNAAGACVRTCRGEKAGCGGWLALRAHSNRLHERSNATGHVCVFGAGGVQAVD